MSDDKVLEYRVSSLEKKLDEELKTINAKLDKLVAQPACPAPGLCQQLNHDMERIDANHAEVFRRLTAVETELTIAKSTIRGAGIGAKLVISLSSAVGGGGIVAALIKLLS